MKLAVGSDERSHLTDAVLADLRQRGHTLILFGPLAGDAVAWPAVARGVAEAVASGAADEGVLFCWTGTGVSIAANKVPGIRCALCTDSLQAEMTRRHNDANVLALGAGITGPNLAKRIVEVFLNTEFEGGRHARRVGQLDSIQP